MSHLQTVRPIQTNTIITTNIPDSKNKKEIGRRSLPISAVSIRPIIFEATK